MTLEKSKWEEGMSKEERIQYLTQWIQCYESDRRRLEQSLRETIANLEEMQKELEGLKEEGN